MSDLALLTVLDDWECDGGAIVGECAQIESFVERWDVETGWSCSVDVGRLDGAAAVLVKRNILRVELVDGTVREYRISDVRDRRGAGAELLGITGQDPRLDLAERVLLSTTGSGGIVYFDDGRAELAATDYLTDIVIPACTAAGLSVSLGTITPTVLVSLDWTQASALALIQQLVQAIRDRGIACEFDFRRNGTTDYQIDLVTAIGSAATTPELHVGRHVTSWERRVSATDQASRVYPFGAVDATGYAATLGHAAWEVSAVSGDVLTLIDPLGGAGPIQFTSQHADPDGAWHLRATDGTLTEIQASSRTSATVSSVTVDTGDGALFTVGDEVEFRADASGTLLASLTHPTYIAAPPTGYGEKIIPLERPALRGERNLAVNPWCNTWTTATDPPDGWTVTAINAAPAAHVTTITREVVAGGLVQFGTYALRLTGNNALGGARIDFPVVPVDPVAGNDLVTVSFSLYHVSAMAPTAPMYLYIAPIGGPTAIVAGPSTWIVMGSSVPVGVRWDVTVAGVQLPAGTASLDVRLQVIGPYDFVVDAYQVTQTAQAADEFFVGPRGNALWQSGNDYLNDFASPPPEFEGNTLDYARISPTTWAAVAVAPGCTTRVVDDDRTLDLSVRAVRLEWNRLIAGDTRITWSTRPRSFAATAGSLGSGNALQQGQGPVPSPPGTPGNGGTPVGTPSPPVVALGPTALLVPFNVLTNQTLTNLPVAETERTDDNETFVDLAPYDYGRLQAHIVTPATQGRLVAKYYDSATSTWEYLDGASGPTLSLASTGTVRGQYVALGPSAKADQIVGLFEVGGDGIEDPVVGSVFLYVTNHAAAPNALCHLIPSYSNGTANILRESFGYTTQPSLAAAMYVDGHFVEPYSCGTLTPRGMRYRIAPGATEVGAVRAYLPAPNTDWSPVKATVFFRQVLYVQPGLDWSAAPSPSGGFPYVWPFQVGGMVGAGSGPAGSIYRTVGEVAYLSMVFDTDWSSFWIGQDPLGTPASSIPTQTFFDTGLLDVYTRWDFTAGTAGVTPSTVRAQVEINGVAVSDTTEDMGDTGTHFVATGFGGFALINRVETITTMSDPLYPWLGPDHWIVLLNELYE